MDALASPTKPVSLGSAVVPLLALVIFINYVDRGNLATAAPLIKDELGLSATQIGVLISAFFWSYTPAQILAGWLAEHASAHKTLAIGLAVWALATAASGLVGSFMALLLFRVVLGAGESVVFPCTSKLLAQHLPVERLGMANGLTLVGLGLGPAFGTFVGGELMSAWGWRDVFVVFGLVSLLWLVPWWSATRDMASRTVPHPTRRVPSFLEIIRRREAVGACLGHFCANYVLYFVISWLPLFLVKERGFSVTQMAEVGGLIYVVYAASTWLSGWFSDRWMRARASANRVRKTGIVGALALIAITLPLAATGGEFVSLASLFVAAMAMGLGTPNVFGIAQTLAGPQAAAKWVGVQNCIGNIAGIVAPIVTGVVVDRTGAFFWAFAVAGAVSLIGTIGWGFVIPRVAPLDWPAAKLHA
jgi:MFS family permease